ncbi:glutamate--cysteine ligase [Actinomyces sp. 2119]|uniref:Putative glutamate--cysteine ligase 2 n=1 Tax=Actinomyces lilanjuaniae TaxID=2321394 RepID=A0ABM6Z299_9ACTO|nr:MULTISPECIES: glutamate--cysteine ligase [Actinomyces]AYD89352.1 glutamate--cysteine ligase [Actinomyces lilanjuaniae]RJF40773.1 glutamate--cysteine ligase [Actinomyces sp. 2119]
MSVSRTAPPAPPAPACDAAARAADHPRRHRLAFASSPRSTLGVEWELALIDRDSLDLRQCAAEVLAAVGDDPHIHGEMMLNTIELVSGARSTVSQCMEDLAFAFDRVLPVTNPLRVDLASAGTHPFADPLVQKVTDAERYARLVDRTRLWGHQMLIFGTHVHVGVEERAKVLPILSALLTRTAHLQCLSASSPFWAGTDTGYADNRAMMFQQLPTAGAPEQLGSWEELEGYTGDLIRTGVIEEFSEIRWDVRPSPRLGTIEVRACDAATNLTELAGVAALTQCLVEDFSRRLDRGQELESMPDWYVAENKWRSARYGMEAVLIVNAAGEEEPVADTITRMLAELAPVAEDLGCAAELDGVRATLETGASYQRQIAAAHAAGGMKEAAVRLLLAEARAGRPLRPAEVLSSASPHHRDVQRHAGVGTEAHG